MSDSSSAGSRRSVPWVWIGVALVMAVAVARELWVSREQLSPLIGKPAPEFSLQLVEPSQDRLRLSDLKGQVVLLDFWASWCGACRASTPALNALQERYGERGLKVIGINVDAPSPERAALGQRTFGIDYQGVWDETRSTQVDYGVDLLPTLVLIDAQGVVQRLEAGVLSERRWAGFIRELL